MTTSEHDDKSTRNQALPAQCVHVAEGELEHLHTLELTTRTEAVQPDYRYVINGDRMRLCAFCTGKVIGMLSRSEFTGGALLAPEAER
jgi:hypothetical protein